MTIASTKARRKIEYEVTGLAASGDLIYRYGEAQHYEPVFRKEKNISFGAGLRFSKMITEIIDPANPDPFSHVAMLQRMAPDDVRVWDMSDEGLRRFELRDWMRETHHWGHIEIRRLLENHQVIGSNAANWLEDLRDEKDPDYDFEFEPKDGQYYCAEADNASYTVQGIQMPDLVELTEQPGYGLTHKLIAWKGKLSTKVALPGNENIGMRSSPLFGVVYACAGEIVP